MSDKNKKGKIMAIIDLPLSELGIEASSAGGSTVETLVHAETEQVLDKAALFLDNNHIAVTKIINAGDYSNRPEYGDKVIDSAYKHFGTTPPPADSRSWTPLGSEAEEGWLSNEVKTAAKQDKAGKYIALRLFDTIVARPDNTQKRLLYANRMGMPVFSKTDSKDVAAETTLAT